MLRNKLKLLIISAIILLALVPASTAAVTDTTGPIKVEILDAYYADLDNDGLEDDVYSAVKVSLIPQGIQVYDYLIELELPSGATFSYYYVIATNKQVVLYDNYFWDHATESGWYKITVSVVLISSNFEYHETTLVFDPPGGHGGSEPPQFTLIGN